MNEAAVFLLAGLSLYAGGHHLYLGLARQGLPWPHLPVAGLYGLLAVFATAWGLSVAGVGVRVQRILDAELVFGCGALLWIGLLWHLARLGAPRRLLVLDLVTAAWIFLGLRPWLPLAVAESPAGAGMPAAGFGLFALGPGGAPIAQGIIPLSLLWALSALLLLVRRRQGLYAGCGAIGLAGLAAVQLHDYLADFADLPVSSWAPFGFALFLLPWSVCIGWRNWRQGRAWAKDDTTETAPPLPCFHRDVAQLRAVPRAPLPAAPVDVSPTSARPAPETTGPVVAQPAAESQIATEPPATPAATLDSAALDLITDNLIDIAVYATMALNRFKRGDADPQTLESLCRKIRTQAIQTRRLTHRLLTDDGGRSGSDET